jgi:hypothetical protein
MRETDEPAKPRLRRKKFSGVLTTPAATLSQQIADHARKAADPDSCEVFLAETREQLVQQLLAKHQTPGAAERIVDEIMDGARELLVEVLVGVQLGQLWEVYTVSASRWSPSTVTDIDGDYITLRAQDNQWHRCHRNDMQNREHYRLVADLGQPRDQLVKQS